MQKAVCGLRRRSCRKQIAGRDAESGLRIERQRGNDMKDQDYMRRAICLAKQGAGWTNPNPMVGAVIVKDGRIIGEGFHRRYGELHAERNAIAALTESAEGASIYVTLEPCCHYGKTPPCTEAILAQGISRVVIGSRDPNPLVSGKGAAMLREHGLTVEEDFLRAECDDLNPVFFHYIRTGKPYVVMKYAMTLDGKIAAYTGESKWITGEEARSHVQTLRGKYAAILAGIGTVLADDPMLNCRAEGAHQPLRVIVDSNLRLPPESRICRTAREYPTVVACAVNPREGAAGERARVLEDMGVRVVSFPAAGGRAHVPEDMGVRVVSFPAAGLKDDLGVSVGQERPRVDLRALTEWLGSEKIDSVLVEGGGQIHETALAAGIVNHVCAYIAPKLLGGADAKTPVEGQGAPSPDEGARLGNRKLTQLGEDLLLEYDIEGGMNGVYWNC